MILIEEYITQTKEARQSHIKLDEPCLERGGNSENFRGLLAHVLDTNIPKGQKIHLCHACHNAACSNINHLYWGTSKENTQDRLANGGRTFWEKLVDKYGYEGACAINAQGKDGNKFGSGNKGKLKSKEHKDNIAASITKMYEDKKITNTYVVPAGRRRALDYDIIITKVKQLGFKAAAVELNLSVTALRGRYYNAVSKEM